MAARRPKKSNASANVGSKKTKATKKRAKKAARPRTAKKGAPKKAAKKGAPKKAAKKGASKKGAKKAAAEASQKKSNAPTGQAIQASAAKGSTGAGSGKNAAGGTGVNPTPEASQFCEWDRLPEAPNCVTIFGGGVAGLTAAHELVERGFQVQVWESQGDQRTLERGCDVGGMARTQWSATNWPETNDVDRLTRVPGTFAARRTHPIVHMPHRFYVKAHTGVYERIESKNEGGTVAFDIDIDSLRARKLQKWVNDAWAIAIRNEIEKEKEKEKEKKAKDDARVEAAIKKEASAIQKAIDKLEAALAKPDPQAKRIALTRDHVVEVHRGEPESAGEIVAPVTLSLIRPGGYYVGEPTYPTTFEFGDVVEAHRALGKQTSKVRIRVHTLGLATMTPEDRRRRLEAFRTAAILALGLADTWAFRPAAPNGYECQIAVKDKKTGKNIPSVDVEIELLESLTADYDEIVVDWTVDRPDSAKNLGERIQTRWRRWWAPKSKDLGSAGRLEPTQLKEGETDTDADVDDLRRRLREVASFVDKIYVEVSAQNAAHVGRSEKQRRTKYVQTLMEGVGSETPYREKLAYPFLDTLPYEPHETPPDGIDAVIGFRLRERWLPGEHGYRFFPSFYHHLFDTMKRTPLLEVEEKPRFARAQERSMGVRDPEPVQYVESERSAFDNLRPTSSVKLAFGRGSRDSQQSRVPIQSLEELKAYLNLIFSDPGAGGFGLSPRDAGRITLKILQFATSCEARREGYEDRSWWEFLDADTLGPNAQRALQRLPEALVAMDAKECDARTQWVPFIQILLDQVRQGDYRDGTLRGPTSEAWLNPWRRYLEAQGVEFIFGSLDGFITTDQGNHKRLWPKVTCYDPRYGAGEAAPLRPGYFVIAVSAEKVRGYARQYLELVAEKHRAVDSDFEKAQHIGGEMSDDELEAELRTPRPNADFRHFAGIQYYFAEDVYWVDGHVYYPDSPWAVTSISQARFWQDKMDWEHGYRGVLSAIVGAWDVEAPRIGKCAWECSEAELAEEAWRQICDGVDSKRRIEPEGVGRFARRTPVSEALPEPIYWHLDQNLKRLEDENGNYYYRNGTPFLIAAPGRFEERPGELDRGYTVEHGFVMAGYYTKTYTRIPSMEAANESARHAVNAILRHLEEKRAPGYRFRRTYCDIWNPEDREVDDLRALKQLDATLFKRGLPHIMETFDLDFLTQHLLRGGDADPFDPLRLLQQIRKLYQARPTRVR